VTDRTAPAAERAAREIAHWRRVADRAEVYWGWGTPAGALRAARRVRFLVERAAVAPGAYCLEVGCGTGHFTEALAATGARLDALDLSPDLLARARARVDRPNVTFILGNVETGEGLRGPYDAVVGISVLHHLDLSRALPALTAVLRPGGRFVFTEPNMLNPQIWLQKRVGWLKRLMGDSPDETAFYRGELAALLGRHGLTRVEVEAFDWLHPSTPRPLISLVDGAGRALERMPGLRQFAGSLTVSAVKA
jgi:2-polyprenyl-3-methyl-5-hydroxy-6-metoxy-1,4-benzoquinol methylase